MPVYEYQCEKCGHTFEAMQAMSDEPLTECSECDGRVQRLLFAPAIHFKGSGFHNTDYGTKKRPKDGEKSNAGADSGASTGSDGTSGGTSGDGGAATKTKEATPRDRAANGTGP